MPSRGIREKWIDVTKGITILLVVLGHIQFLPEFLYKYIYSFHMPLFFFISGLVFSENKLSLKITDFIKDRWRRIIIPYFCMSLICYVVFVLLMGKYKQIQTNTIYYLKPMLGIIYSRGITEWMPNCSPLWFLTCLFMVNIIVYFIIKTLLFYKGYNLICVMLVLVLFGVVTTFIPVKLPWNIDTAITASVFSLLGFYIKKERDNFKQLIANKEAVLLVLSIMASTISVKFNTVIDMDGNKYGNILLFYLGAIGGIYTIIYISKMLDNKSIFIFYGKNTMPIIGFNYAINSVINMIFRTSNPVINYIAAVVLCGVMITILRACGQKYPVIKEMIYGER